MKLFAEPATDDYRLILGSDYKLDVEEPLIQDSLVISVAWKGILETQLLSSIASRLLIFG